LQLGWVAVVASVSAGFILAGLHQTSKLLFTVIVIIWIYSLAWVAIKGIRYVGQAAKYLNWIPLIMIVIVFWTNRSGIAHYAPPLSNSLAGFLGVLTIVIGYFATAGAAGADFGMNNRNPRDIILGGVFGIVLGVVIAVGCPFFPLQGISAEGRAREL